MTEPSAGSDLALLRSKGERIADGTYRISGQKIFITYGDHDMADNIIHLGLARLPDAPEGVKGISLFVVPKFLKDGTRNDVKCVSIEHKLGSHASPTCTMQFGDEGGAIGYIVGEENEGLKYMFTMMNNARLSVGLQGVAISERAVQAAKFYAADRKQGKPLTGGDTVTIDRHPDIKRMVMTMVAEDRRGHRGGGRPDAAHAGAGREPQARQPFRHRGGHHSYQRLIEEFQLTQADVARLVGRDRSTVANAIRLLKLPPDVTEMVDRGRLSEGHARALLALSDRGQITRLAQLAADQGWSVRELEAKVRGSRPAVARKEPVRELAPAHRRVEEALCKGLGTDVRVTARRRGRVACAQPV